METKVSIEHARNVCGLGRETFACSFLALSSEDGWVCLKNSAMEAVINRRRAERTTAAMGDNCSGPPDFVPTKETIN